MAIRRPAVSIVAVQPGDPFEIASQNENIAIHIRCAWENTTQGVPKTPIFEFVSLTLDDQLVNATLVTQPANRGLSDHFHYFVTNGLTSGEHRATVVVRSVKSNERLEETIRFVQP